MSALKRIRDFKAPKDAESAVELRRQLGQFESNVSDMGDQLQRATMPRLQVVGIARSVGDVILSPGQAAGFDTSAGDISIGLSKPTAADAGNWVAVWKLSAANTLTVRMPAGVTVNGSDSLTAAAIGLTPIFCDGVNYWID